MGHEPVLIPDQTLLIQLALFMASYFVLRFFVFKPFIELLHERREKTLGAKEKAQSDQQVAEQYQQQYEDFVRGERKRLADWSEQERRKIGDEERKTLEKARATVSQQHQAVSAALVSQLESARKELRSQVPEYAGLLASKILGKKVQVSATSGRQERVAEDSVSR